MATAVKPRDIILPTGRREMLSLVGLLLLFGCLVWLGGVVCFFCFCALDKKEKYKSRIRLIRGVIAFLPYSGLFGWCGLVFLGLLSLWFAG